MKSKTIYKTSSLKIGNKFKIEFKMLKKDIKSNKIKETLQKKSPNLSANLIKINVRVQIRKRS